MMFRKSITSFVVLNLLEIKLEMGNELQWLREKVSEEEMYYIIDVSFDVAEVFSAGKRAKVTKYYRC